MTASLSCVLAGENALLAECASRWLEKGHRIIALIAPDPELRAWARRRNIPALARFDELEPALDGAPFDYLFSISNLRLVPQRLLTLPRRLAVNFHDALLPRHAGLHATSWALLASPVEKSPVEHGVTWHVMTEAADEGDILLQRGFTVDADETAYSLNIKCFQAGADSFAELTDLLAAGGERRVPQNLGLRTYHGRHDVLPDGGLLRWSRDGAALHALVRATCFGPHPNRLGTAKAVGPGEILTVAESRLSRSRSGLRPGTVVSVDGDGITVATGGGDLTLGGFALPDAEPVTPLQLAARWGLERGRLLPEPDDEAVGELVAQLTATRADEAYWVRRLAGLRPMDLCHRGAVTAPAAVGRLDLTTAAPPGLASIRPGDRAGALLAAVLLYLARTAGEDEADIGFRAAQHAADARLFAAAVPLRLPVPEPGLGFADYCVAVADAVAAADKRVGFLRDVRSRYPVLRKVPGPHGLPIVVRIGAADTEQVGGGTAEILVSPTGDRCVWRLSADRIAADAAEALRADFGAFLRALADAPHDVAAVPLLSGSRRQLVLDRWNATGADYPRDRCVPDLIARQARRRPEAVAVVSDGGTLTYRGLQERSDRLAVALADRGVEPGDLVGVHLRRSADLVVGLLGVMKAGAAYVPLDPVYPPDRIRAMLADAGARLVVTNGGPTSPWKGVLPELCLDRLPQGVVVPSPYAARPDGLAYVIYTSGSTGRPKGVRVGHRALVNFLCSMAGSPGCTADDRLLAVTTVCFDIAGLELFLPLISGGSTELVPERTATDGFALRKRIRVSRPTLMQATPATWRMLIAAGWDGEPGLRALCGGEALPPDLAAGLLTRCAQLWNLYGPTETTIWSSAVRLGPGDRITLGRPIANTRCYVRDAQGRPLPPYVPGELYIGGDGVADGYHARPELTAEKFTSDELAGTGRLYRTGDLVRYLADGRLEYLNRIDDQVKLHGYRIELGEIEAALTGHGGVARAVVVVREDVPGDRRLVAYLVPSASGLPGAATLRGHLARLLPGYMVPALFVPLVEIPVTRNGKVDRKALPVPPVDAGTGQAGPRPQDGAQAAVAAIWRRVLRRDDIGADDNFFDAGGSSLLIVEVISNLNSEFGVDLASVDMFRNPTVRSMATHLSALAGVGPMVSATAYGRRLDRSLIHRRRNRP
ncbi:amino acid adenylation domain-containing protein [Streptomyces sp. MZ04]|uniref:amino acid adenylation domain-containing protein n=1 Tax=Streptomyces sp. MZ04 TaxID=2559236 RepID=UPI00107E8BD7|nr:amino acid adenylation domain-containing protein [Streptomyces sp. MZ04]TGB15128.1 amino acid adenylation domain-containing protein [Streptomyces sp. MZ04]